MWYLDGGEGGDESGMAHRYLAGDGEVGPGMLAKGQAVAGWR